MIKRIIALILSMAILVLSCAVVSAEEKVIATDAEQLLFELGLLDLENHASDSELTRGKFASMISRFCLLQKSNSSNTWMEENFGTTSTDGDVLPQKPLFDDVDSSHSDYEGISNLVSLGYMNGISENKFAPDIKIVFSDAIKVVVSMLGYDYMAEIKGGYPLGYNQVATDLKLLKSISISVNEVPKSSDIAQLLYNALDVKVASVDGISDNSVTYSTNKGTFLSENLKIGKITGRMTDNGITSLTSEKPDSANSMIVSGMKLEYDDEKSIYSRYIGRQVTAYYEISDDNTKTCIYVKPIDEIKIFTADDYVSFSSGVLNYSMNGKVQKVNVPRNAVIICNGVYIDSYTNSLFDIKQGEISIIEDYEVPIFVIKEYKDFYISSITADSKTIYNEMNFSSLSDGIKSISLDPNDSYERIAILDENNKFVPFSELKSGDVVSVMTSPNGEYVEVLLCRDSVSEFTVNSKTDESVFNAEKEEYTFSYGYGRATNKPELDIGKEYTLFLNAFGKVVWAKSTLDTGDKMGILTAVENCSISTLEDYYIMRIYDETDGLTYYELPKTVSCDGVSVKRENLAATLSTVIGKPIIFKLNDKMVKEIKTPSPLGSSNNNGWYQVSYDVIGQQPVGMSDADWSTYKTQNWFMFNDSGDGPSFGGLFSYNSNTKIFVVPASVDEYDNEKRFSVNRKSFSSSTRVAVEAYSTIKNDPVPSVIICREDSRGSGDLVSKTSAFLIKSVTKGIVDDEIVLLFNGYKFTRNNLVETSFVVNEDAVMLQGIGSDGLRSREPLDPMTATVANDGPLTYKDLEAGDIIRYATNIDDEITSIRIAFDYSQKKAFDNLYDSQELANYYGPAVLATNNGIKIATTIAPENIDYTNVSDVKTIKGYRVGANYPFVFVWKRGDKLMFKTGTINDIETYEMTNAPGGYDNVCIMSHFSGGEIGGVVYVR